MLNYKYYIEGKNRMKISTAAVIKAMFLMKSERTCNKWTDDTIMCKQRGCECAGCVFEKYPCTLKNKVLALVGEIGKPEDIIEPTIYNRKEELEYLTKRYSKGTVCHILGVTRFQLEKMLREV